ncbi:DUF922 domain-containing protein [Jiella sp. MQZ9-1]|uniref:DUF922 domain-containing protein n=1 Tax=Jiella flava TaxID=2816857 RepID=A0A939FZS7_9HYPH|nr:DUF922 domain-containing protein [Jiella flava]MBO0662998.1 DUF922 domain-containing protein [Jiella flava]MCD2471243.1 DUF922 domain-containing protein [Jiella flava]
MMMKSIRLAAALLIMLPVCTNAATIRETTSYFIIRGKTLNELDRSLNSHSPYVAATGARHPGVTEVTFGGKITYKQTPQGCAVDQAHMSLTLKITLPKWIPPRGVDARTKLIWDTLAADIKRHEDGHAAIAKNHVKRMESAIRNLSPEQTCPEMEAKVNTVAARYLASHERAQLEFDTVEGREVNFRLHRALARAMDAAQSR